MTFWDRMTPAQKSDPELFWVNFMNPERGVRALQALSKAMRELEDKLDANKKVDSGKERKERISAKKKGFKERI